MPLRRAVNVVWHFLTKDGTKKSIEQLKADLIRPLPGMSEEVSEDVIASEMSMFQKSMQKNKK